MNEISEEFITNLEMYFNVLLRKLSLFKLLPNMMLV